MAYKVQSVLLIGYFLQRICFSWIALVQKSCFSFRARKRISAQVELLIAATALSVSGQKLRCERPFPGLQPVLADPGGQRQKSLPPTNVLKLDTERRKFTESCRCQTCEVKAVRVCTSTPKKNRCVVWMILLML